MATTAQVQNGTDEVDQLRLQVADLQKSLAEGRQLCSQLSQALNQQEVETRELKAKIVQRDKKIKGLEASVWNLRSESTNVSATQKTPVTAVQKRCTARTKAATANTKAATAASVTKAPNQLHVTQGFPWLTAPASVVDQQKEKSNDDDDDDKKRPSTTVTTATLPWWIALAQEPLLNNAKRPNSNKISEPPKDAPKPAPVNIKPSRKDIWNQRFEELIDFKLEHGHCNVPIGRKKKGENNPLFVLGWWAEGQRRRYKRAQQGRCKQHSPERLRKLQSIGFAFQYTSPFFKTFEERVQQLAEYKAEHGHCNVPQSGGEGIPKGLGNFVLDQRKYYNYGKQGKKNTLTQERIDQLNALGFHWSLRSHQKQQQEEEEGEYFDDFT